ncbi:MAG: hypothetical protein ABL884_09525 [Methyloglobulus sp.]
MALRKSKSVRGEPSRTMNGFTFFAHSQALLGNVVLQAGACLVGFQSGDWELAQTSVSPSKNTALTHGQDFFKSGGHKKAPSWLLPEWGFRFYLKTKI